jgi:mono/diheme cytochrome c family protein
VACAFLTASAVAQQSSSWTISAPKATPNSNARVARGQEAYQARCIACHGRVSTAQSAGIGTRAAGTQALQARYQGQKPAALEDRTDLTPDFVRFIVRKGSGIMPFFRKTEVSDSELEAIAAYLSASK